ncbi:hypothetical protein CYMTET_38256 [Cymbomonas tetramitiformis]|uniref:Uncharacterized protein n=1 Tax=Cymbomonas tetramitiformis TaxID=36881 RepID=A0AAE0CDW0_9CHLO|nr:hypothetical protein CYMTET_38256 [Cymbomonas tetramitiformis]
MSLCKISLIVLSSLVLVDAAGKLTCTKYTEAACAGNEALSYVFDLNTCYEKADVEKTGLVLDGEFYYLFTATDAEDVVYSAVYTDDECGDLVNPEDNSNAWSALGPWLMGCTDLSSGESLECEIAYDKSDALDALGGLMFGGVGLAGIGWIAYQAYQHFYVAPTNVPSPKSPSVNRAPSAQDLIAVEDGTQEQNAL